MGFPSSPALLLYCSPALLLTMVCCRGLDCQSEHVASELQEQPNVGPSALAREQEREKEDKQAGNPSPRPVHSELLALSGPDSVTEQKLLRWEMTHQLDEDGAGELIIKQSTFAVGGLGAFATRKPAPIEYKRDLTAPNQGWLTQEECDTGWDRRTPWSTYIMEVIKPLFSRPDGGNLLPPRCRLRTASYSLFSLGDLGRRLVP